MRQRVTAEQIRLAKSVDLISYMKQYEPQELIRTGPHDYKTTTHSSLCISDNGLWHWFSHGIGGRGALNYLIQVKGMDFVSAVRHLCELEHLEPVPFQQVKRAPVQERKPFVMPVPDKNAETALQYLKRRGIDGKILKYCVDQGILYQTTRGGYKNCVFVGKDTEGKPRSACVRGCQGTFRGECAGSEKQYGFCIPADNDKAEIVEVYEAPIDALSGATLQLLYGHDWRSVHHVSLGGLNYVALDQYLKDHPGIKKLRLRLDTGETSSMRNYVPKVLRVRSASSHWGRDIANRSCGKGWSNRKAIQAVGGNNGNRPCHWYIRRYAFMAATENTTIKRSQGLWRCIITIFICSGKCRSAAHLPAKLIFCYGRIFAPLNGISSRRSSFGKTVSRPRMISTTNGKRSPPRWKG